MTERTPPPTATQRYDGYTLEQLKEEVKFGNQPEVVREIASRWSALGTDYANANGAFSSVKLESERYWEGVGGEAQREDLQRMADWANQAHLIANELGLALQRQADVVEHAVNDMPDLVPYDTCTILKNAANGESLPGFMDMMCGMSDYKEKVEAARAKAIEVLVQRDEGLRQAAVTKSFTKPPMPSTK